MVTSGYVQVLLCHKFLATMFAFVKRTQSEPESSLRFLLDPALSLTYLIFVHLTLLSLNNLCLLLRYPFLLLLNLLSRIESELALVLVRCLKL